MSNTPQHLQVDNLDTALHSADKYLYKKDQSETSRPKRAWQHIEIMPLNSLKCRLSWRPQPKLIDRSYLKGLFPNGDAAKQSRAPDLSFSFMLADLLHSFPADEQQTVMAGWEADGSHTHSLTYVAALAALPGSCHTTKLRIRIEFLARLSLVASGVSKESLWLTGSSASREVQIRRCGVFSLLQRVAFYKMRAASYNLEAFRVEMAKMREICKIPSDWNAQSEVLALGRSVVEEWTAIEDRFDTPADKELVGTPIPLEQVTTPVQLDEHLEED
jgi:hypothetical protein